jgi:beta-N-acetylhexosaminidase
MPKGFISGCRGTALAPDERAFLRQEDPWGLILFKRNVESRAQLQALTAEFRSLTGRADAPVLIDQEGGRVQRMGPPHWRAYPAAARLLAELPADAAEQAAWSVARLIAHDLREVGITVDCAPVLDVADDATHAVIGTRAYAKAPDEVARLGRAVMEGLIAGGVLPVAKHVPGHGRARADSHLELPIVEASHAELSARDFAPFRALKDAPAAMSAHIVYTALDGRAPATLSSKIVNEIIRGEIGFSGLLISDDLSMKALKGDFTARTHGVFEAGLDIALHCNGDLAEGRPVAEASPPLAGRSLARAEAALARVSGGPQPFDAEAGYARLVEMWPALATL